MMSSIIGLIVTCLTLGMAAADRDILIYSQEPPRLLMEEFLDMPAKFGPDLPTEGLRAFVVVGEPKNGCVPLRPPPDMPNFTGNWVVMLARYNCSFEAKVRNAQQANYDGVIIHNVNSNDLEIMTANDSKGIKIPSVFIGQTAGSIIESSYVYDNGYFLIINGDMGYINTHILLPFAIAIAVCLVVMILILIVKCVQERRRARRHRLPNSSLKKIPTCKFAKGDPYDTCAICLDDYVEGDKLRVLPCAHAYHCKCIDPWLTKNRRVCPVCKRKVIAMGERRRRTNSDSDSDDDDDDRAPLVNQSRNYGATRTAAHPLYYPTNEAQSSQSANENSRDQRRPQRSSQTDRRGTTRGNPFLAGVLNLRGDRFAPQNQNDNVSLNDERRPLIAAGASTSSRSRSVEAAEGRSSSRTSGNGRKSRRSRRSEWETRQRQRPNPTQTSSGSANEPDGSPAAADDAQEERGRIGVAALPNTEDQQRGRRGNDFIV